MLSTIGWWEQDYAPAIADVIASSPVSRWCHAAAQANCASPVLRGSLHPQSGMGVHNKDITQDLFDLEERDLCNPASAPPKPPYLRTSPSQHVAARSRSLTVSKVGLCSASKGAD